MCLPLGFLKAWVGISSIIILGLGVAMIVFDVLYSSKYLKNIMDISEDLNSSAFKFVKYGPVVLGSLLTLIGLCGLIQTCKKNKCLLVIYDLGTLIFAILFLALGIVCIDAISNQYSFSPSEIQKCNINYLQQANNYSNFASQTFCSPRCPCSLTNKKDLNQTVVKNLTIDPIGGVNQTQQCNDTKKYSQDHKDLDKIASALNFFEDNFQCSGVCQASPIYLWSNVNNGKPAEACATKIADLIKSSGQKVGIFSLVVGGVLFLSIIFACCIQYHPEIKKRQQEEPLRQGQGQYYGI